MTGPEARLLVVQPDPLAHLFAAEDWLRDEGVEWTVVRPYEGDAVPERLEHDGLVVLGGSMSSLDDEAYAWLEDIRSLQRTAAGQATPSLGICLGAQLMAQAFGGATAVGDSGLESGVAAIRWTGATEGDPVTGGLSDPFPAGTMHGDMVSVLPPDATLLGTGAVYRNQVFRVSATSWGVQFHPEIDLAAYASWVEAEPDAPAESRQRLLDGRAEFAAGEKQVLGGNEQLMRNFVQVVKAVSPALQLDGR